MGNPLINYEILYIPIEWCTIDVWTQIPMHMLKSQDLNTWHMDAILMHFSNMRKQMQLYCKPQTWCSCTHKRDVHAHKAQDRKHYLRFLYHNQNTQHYNNIKTPPTQET
jgi:hypothetical protein